VLDVADRRQRGVSMEITPRFTLVGEDTDDSADDLADAGTATVIPVFQETYLEEGEPFQQGGRVGELHGTAVVTGRGNLVCALVFTFDADMEDTIVAHGVLQRHGGGIGEGRLAIGGGTGRYRKLSGDIEVQTRNPKRYIFNL
jgi:hypothetical protein